MNHPLVRDLKLLDLVQSETDLASEATLALRERLAVLCQSHAVGASEEAIEAAVDHYLAETEPPTPFALWPRPSDQEEWQADLAVLATNEARSRRFFERGFRIGLWLACVSGGVIGTIGYRIGMSEGGWSDGVLAGLVFTTLGWIATIGACAISLLFWQTTVGRLWAYRQAGRRVFNKWRQPGESMEEVQRGLSPVKGRVKRMQEWLAVPEVAEALRQIAQSGVPVLVNDAVHLDALSARVKRDRRRARARAEQKVWDESLQALATSR